MIDIRNVHYQALALKTQNQNIYRELDLYVLLRSLNRLRSAFDPGIRPLSPARAQNTMQIIQSKAQALGIDSSDVFNHLTGCSDPAAKVKIIDTFSKRCRLTFALRKHAKKLAWVMFLILVLSVGVASY